MNARAKRLVDEFEKKYHIYEDFCAAIYKLLNNLAVQNGYKYQIFYRIKKPKRLAEKIARKEKEGKVYKKLSDVGDLAGVRVVFYLESDKRRFIRDIKREIGSPVVVGKYDLVSGYRAEHLIITLGPERLKLSEYKKFRKLKCEVQLTSILDHAWAEIEHDWLYKDIHGFKEKNPKKYIFIKKKMEYVFDNYVKKTGLEFEKIARRVRRYCN